MLELKSPEEDCGNPHFVKQLQSYMVLSGTPIGVLFNGLHAAVYVNPKHDALRKPLADRAIELEERPVIKKDADDRDGLFSVFSQFPCQTAPLDTVKLVKRLARALPPPTKTEEIRNALQQMLHEPTADVALALVNVSAELADLGATPEILLEVWPLDGPARGPLNPEVRRLVAEVCGKVGYDALVKRKIKGLRMRTDGHQTAGFRLVRDAGAPQGLTVQGVDGPAARRIIKELERLLAQTSE